MNNPIEMISTVEARVMMLEQKNDAFHQTLKSIESRMDRIESKLDRTDSKIESNFKWILGIMLPGFASIIGIMARGFHWF